MTFKIIGGPPAETPYAYLAVKPKPLTLTADEAVMRMPSPDKAENKKTSTTSSYADDNNGATLSSFPSPSPLRTTGAKSNAQASVERNALMQSQQQGPPLWSPRNPLFHNSDNNSNVKNTIATSSDEVQPNNSTSTMEDPMHLQGNYAKRLFEEILEARQRRLQEYDDNTRRGLCSQPHQIGDHSTTASTPATSSMLDEGDVTVVERKLLFERAQKIIAQLENEDDNDSEDEGQQQHEDRTDEEEIALLKARRIRKQKRLASEAYARDRDADMLPWCEQILMHSIMTEIDNRTSRSEQEADFLLLKMNEEEGIRREAARMAENFVHAAIVAERERRYFDTVDPVMSQLRKEAEARRLAAAEREAALEEEELAALEKKFELMATTTSSSSSSVGRKQQTGPSKTASTSTVNDALRIRQQQLVQQREAAALYEQQQQQQLINQSAELIDEQQRKEEEEKRVPSPLVDVVKVSQNLSVVQNNEKSKEDLVAPGEVTSLLDVIELAADSDNLGRGLSLLLQGMDL